MDQQSIRLIVGLGNPGSQYEKTRHNVGVWLIERLLQQKIGQLTFNKKFKGRFGKLSLFDQEYFVLIPETYMNNSGQAVGSVARFYKIAPREILIAHDEMDLPVGTVRLKQGGGMAGHKGLDDIVSHLGSHDFHRIRIGIGHPQNVMDVMDYVLNRPTHDEQKEIDAAIDQVIAVLPFALQGEWQKAMNQLHVL